MMIMHSRRVRLRRIDPASLPSNALMTGGGWKSSVPTSRATARRALLLAAFFVITGIGGEAHAAACAGTCAADLATNAKAVQQYAKKASAAFSKCLKSGNPACPTPCPLPDPATFDLSEACAALLQCRLGDLVDAATGDSAWDAGGRCATNPGANCDIHRFTQARKLAARALAAVRKQRPEKLGRLGTRCESEVRYARGCADSGAACAAAEAIVHGLMESLYTACDAVPLTEVEMAAAVQQAIDQLAARGVRIGPQAWHDATDLFALITQTFMETDCLERAQAIATAQRRTASLEDGETVYCGPNSCIKGAPGCVLPDPGACLNSICASHDGCYGQVAESECIRRDCTWSSQTLDCDAAFFVEAALCWGLEQCGFTCKAVIAAATAFTTMNVQVESGGLPCPRQVGQCPLCPGQCHSDCSCPSSPTTTTTIPPGCEFSCSNGSCISASIVCNGIPDCPGGEDEDPGVCFDPQNCCVATRGCPEETGSSCAATCCCCPLQQACCADSSQGCCAAP
jgi:hypothetical protein